MQPYTTAICVRLLQQKQAELRAAGQARYPQRSDFPAEEVIAIKQLLGPWPRALEAAGLKPLRDDDHAQRSAEKRIRAKRRRNAARRESKADTAPCKQEQNSNNEEKSS